MSKHPYSSTDPSLIYILSRFPTLSETFILREMTAVSSHGWAIRICPFIRVATSIDSPEVIRWKAACIESSTVFLLIVSTLYWLFRAPFRLASLYALVVRELWRHPGTLARAIVALILAARWSYQVRHTSIAHVHAHFALHPAVAALAMGRLLAIPFSFTCHAHDVYSQPAMLGTKVCNARFVVTISQLLREQYLRAHVAPTDFAKVHIIHCGVDTTRYALRTFVSTPHVLRLVAVSRLVEKKGLRYLIEACTLLHARGTPFQCYIIGAGPLYQDLHTQIVASELCESIVLQGARSEQEVKDVLLHADIFIQPSIIVPLEDSMEGIPVSLMEAMALGVPVIATATGAIRELVQHEHTGLLVAPADAAAIAAAIERIVEDPKGTAQMIVTARAHIEQEFDLFKSAAQLDQHFRGAPMERRV